MSSNWSDPDLDTARGARCGERVRPSFALRFGALLVLLLLVVVASGLGAQEIGSGRGARFGISFGGISTIGLTVEFFRGHQSIEVTAGTWSFRDLSVAVDAREYIGDGSVHPFVGLGFWAVGARPRGGRLGLAAVLQAPIGVDARVVGRHSLGAVVNVNRALAVRRTDPEDDLPLNHRLVPLPGLYYRWTR